MANSGQYRNWICTTCLPATKAALAITILLALTLISAQSAQAQTYNVIHNFSGGGDGAYPDAGLTKDAAGNFYGTTLNGGIGYGAVFELKRVGSNWVVVPLYAFKGGPDGAGPLARVIIGPNGNLYGTTQSGGVGTCTANGYIGCGTVFKLSPPATVCRSFLCPWTETVLYRFSGGSDGALSTAEVVFDQSGNMYSTTVSGGASNFGTVFKLAPNGDGTYTESVLYSYPGVPGLQNDFASPAVIFDQMGNLYGTTDAGGTDNQGTVFELKSSGGSWTPSILFSFTGDGSVGTTPESGLVFDSSGNLYGATTNTGPNGGGVVFELVPNGDGTWTYNLLYGLSGPDAYRGPSNRPVLDAGGNVYDTTVGNGLYGYGSVFKLTHSDGMWTYTSLHDFCSGGPPCSDGAGPYTDLVFDATGNLWGTTTLGGIPYDGGVAFEITQPF